MEPILAAADAPAVLAAAPAVLAAETSGAGAGGLGQLLFPILLLVLFFVFIVRPQRRRQREFAEMQASLTEGMAVVTSAGLYGRIVELAPEFVILEAAPGVRLKYARAAVARVQPEDDLSYGSTSDPVLPPD